MADTKISALTDGAAVAATDRIPVARTPFASGDNRYVTGTELADFVLGGSGGTQTLPVSRGGTGQTTEAEALGEMIQALGADASPDSAADYVVTYDASADTGKKVLLSNLPGSISTPVSVANGGTGQTTEAEALGEMLQACASDSNPDGAADYLLAYDASADTGKKVLINTILAGSIARVVLATQTDFYVRTPAATVTMTTASPTVVTWTSHGLSANDAVVFSKPPDGSGCTMTIASPCVVTKDVTLAFANNDRIQFATTGALPTGLTVNTDYFVINVSGNTFQVSATSGGSAINTSGSQSGLHYVHRNSRLDANVTEGTIYYVLATDLSTHTFKFATTPGGTAINTSVATIGKITASTGSDDNDGTSSAKANAWLTLENAATYITNNVDFNGVGGFLEPTGSACTVNLAESTYREEVEYHRLTNHNAGSDFFGCLVRGPGPYTSASNTMLISEIPITVSEGGWWSFSNLRLGTIGEELDTFYIRVMNYGRCTLGSFEGFYQGALVEVICGDQSTGNDCFVVHDYGSLQIGYDINSTAFVVINVGSATGGFSRLIAAYERASVSSFGYWSFWNPMEFDSECIDALTMSSIDLSRIVTMTKHASITGKRYNVEHNSIINTNNKGETFLPGDTTGTLQSGGGYG